MSKILKLNIVKPGLHTTVQDQGREAYRAYGIPASGPMDRDSAYLANHLLGNPPDNPVLEFTMIGPEIILEGQGQIAITGGKFDTRLDQDPLGTRQVVAIDGTHRLAIGRVLTGCRGYLAVAGTWNIGRWLGSCSTAAQNPGLVTPESHISKGMIIRVQPSGSLHLPEITSETDHDGSKLIRVIAGPEYDHFDTATIMQLLGDHFTVSNESNRMGYRLNPSLDDYSAPPEIISSGVVPGTIQVAHSGQLIILMNDAQTTGGYPRIANVLSADLSKMGQRAPGDPIKFRLISFNEALGLSVK
jgi:antagonist of KipI